jgi:hypothetical protein
VPFNTVSFTGQQIDQNSWPVGGGTKGTQPTFNGNPLFTGEYVRFGNLVHFEIQVDMDNITSFGSGQYYMTLPFPAKFGYDFREGCLHHNSSQFHISGHVFGGSTELLLYSSDKISSGVQDIAFTSTFPTTITVSDNFHICGTYIAEA